MEGYNFQVNYGEQPSNNQSYPKQTGLEGTC